MIRRYPETLCGSVSLSVAQSRSRPWIPGPSSLRGGILLPSNWSIKYVDIRKNTKSYYNDKITEDLPNLDQFTPVQEQAEFNDAAETAKPYPLGRSNTRKTTLQVESCDCGRTDASSNKMCLLFSFRRI